MTDNDESKSGKTTNANLAETLKKIDPAALANALSSSQKRSLDAFSTEEVYHDDDNNDNDDNNDDEKQQPPKRAKCEEIKEKLKGHSIKNEYNGWVVPENGYIVPSIDVNNITPENFYHDYVSKRKPIVLKGQLEDIDGLQKWIGSNHHLRNRAGEENVMVEVRADDKASFGRGNEVAMTFNKFLDLLESGDSKHYLTTQDVEANEDGQPDLMAPFMKTLKDDFPLRPKLVGNLVPQNLNLWFGNNSDGASSGLHHDYHDNLYIILRGRKRFRLYSPADTENIYPKGALLKIHPNGRINYEGEETTAYGADLQADAAAKASYARELAEQKLIEAEQRVEQGLLGAEEELELAEEMLEKAMDDLIDAEMGDNEEGDEDDDMDDEDYSGAIDEIEEKEDEIEEYTSNPRRIVDKTVKDPNNFSNVTPGVLLDEDQLKEKFPRMKSATAAHCDLAFGDILYLPASWWHEVTSFGREGNQGHLAMNYWFHPPDSNDFANPYSTAFWPNDYNLRYAK
jgi:hypothetical protein